MEGRRAEVRGVLGSLGILLLVSAYRQLSLRLLPGDAARPYIVCAVYLGLLLSWGISIRSRFTQRSMRTFLLTEMSAMLFWLAVRFVQETVVPQNIYAVRILGYFIIVPAVTIPLLGLYAAFGLGRGDEYRFSRGWYLLAVPAAAMIAITLTNESHHWVYRVVAGEPQPNLYFHPNYGIFVVYGWIFLLVIARTLVIYRRNRPVKNKSALQKLAPYLGPTAMLAFCIPYTASSFWVRWELVEFSAGVFALEAASWELFIWLGLIPVNTQYKTVFDRSTASMQILSEDGVPIVRSDSAPALTPEQFSDLIEQKPVITGTGQELQAYKIRDGYFVWQRDVSRLRRVIAELRKSSAELEQESALLAQELKIKSEEAAVAEQNRIYNQLTLEVGPQLRLLEKLLEMLENAPDKAEVFQRIGIVGAYVKRRCSLRLIEQTDGTITGEDLALGFRELEDHLRGMNIDARLDWSDAALPSARFALLCFDVFEYLLEYHQFKISAVRAALLPDSSFSVSVCPSGTHAAAPAEELARMEGTGFSISCAESGMMYTVHIREGGEDIC